MGGGKERERRRWERAEKETGKERQKKKSDPVPPLCLKASQSIVEAKTTKLKSNGQLSPKLQ